MKTSQHIFPDLAAGMAEALSEEPVFLDGMEVLFDIKVALYPVNLTKKEEKSKDVPTEQSEQRILR